MSAPAAQECGGGSALFPTFRTAAGRRGCCPRPSSSPFIGANKNNLDTGPPSTNLSGLLAAPRSIARARWLANRRDASYAAVLGRGASPRAAAAARARVRAARSPRVRGAQPAGPLAAAPHRPLPPLGREAPAGDGGSDAARSCSRSESHRGRAHRFKDLLPLPLRLRLGSQPRSTHARKRFQVAHEVQAAKAAAVGLPEHVPPARVARADAAGGAHRLARLALGPKPPRRRAADDARGWRQQQQQRRRRQRRRRTERLQGQQ